MRFQGAGIIQLDIRIHRRGINLFELNKQRFRRRAVAGQQFRPPKTFQEHRIACSQRALHRVLIKRYRFGIEAAIERLFGQFALGIHRSDQRGLALRFAIGAARIGGLDRVAAQLARAAAVPETGEHGEEHISPPQREHGKKRNAAHDKTGQRNQAQRRQPHRRLSGAEDMIRQGQIDQQKADGERIKQERS